MNDMELWKMMNEAWAALTEKFQPVVESVSAEEGLPPRDWGLLLAVLTFEPEDTTPGHLMVRSPYTSSEAFFERLTTVAQNGYLNEVSTSRFQLTQKGRSSTLRIIDLVREKMAEVDPLSNSESQKAVLYLERLVDSCRETPVPPNHWSIDLSYKLMPSKEPAMPYIEQALSCLAAYRDDAHLAAWRNAGLSATALEALTLFWRGQASSLETLCDRLSHRGHSCHVYEDAMNELSKLGYLNGTMQEPWVTGKGRVFRNRVEEDTDGYFYRPWDCLRADQKSDLFVIMTKMRDGLAT